MTTRDYPVDGLTIHWDSARCQHSGICATTLPEVFRPAQRPWIDAEGAPVDDIARTIDVCPSGALSYTRDGVRSAPVPVRSEPDPPRAQVTAHRNGPLEVRGEMTVVGADGAVLRESRRQYFCRCGNSGNKPFCDGSHNRVGFRDPE